VQAGTRVTIVGSSKPKYAPPPLDMGVELARQTVTSSHWTSDSRLRAAKVSHEPYNIMQTAVVSSEDIMADGLEGVAGLLFIPPTRGERSGITCCPSQFRCQRRSRSLSCVRLPSSAEFYQSVCVYGWHHRVDKLQNPRSPRGASRAIETELCSCVSPTVLICSFW
jgi:hypothetical protein